MSEIHDDEIAPDDCVYRGVVYQEHDYDETECRRCGAEAPQDDVHDSVCEQCGNAHVEADSSADDQEMFCSSDCERLYNALRA